MINKRVELVKIKREWGKDYKLQVLQHTGSLIRVPRFNGAAYKVIVREPGHSVKLLIPPGAYAFGTSCGIFDKDIIEFYDIRGEHYLGTVSLIGDSDWIVVTHTGVMISLEEIKSFRSLGSLLCDETIDNFKQLLSEDVLKDDDDQGDNEEEAVKASPSAEHHKPRRIKEYVVYTDGSALQNPGPAGYSYLIVCDNEIIKEKSCPIGYETNNRAEIMGIYEGITEALKDDPTHIQVFSDSEYAINAITKWSPGWKKKNWIKSDGRAVLNRDLFEDILELIKDKDISFTHVKGHSGNNFNERCDFLAKEAARSN